MSATPNATPADQGLNICVIGSTYRRAQDDYTAAAGHPARPDVYPIYKLSIIV
jgi:hypothetical protein